MLLNAWDAASAVMFEKLGAEAIATTSAGFAWANGYSDGSLLPQRVLLDGVAAIARVTNIPISVDFEGGYSDDPDEVAEWVRALLSDDRVSGINIEDGDTPPELLERKIRAIRRVAGGAGVDLFVNARIDVYLRELVAAKDALRVTMDRIARYEAAGCDGIFVPGLSNPLDIAKLVRATALPINVLASPTLPTVDELRKIGVRRLSVGSAIALRTYDSAQQLAAAILKDGPTADLFASKSMSYAKMNELMSPLGRK